MKKIYRFLKNSIVLIILSMTIVNSPSVAFDYYTAGKKAFESNDYEKASQYFAYELKRNPLQTKCRYYYAQTLINQKKFDKAQQQYEKIIEIAPLSYEAAQSIAGIAGIEKYRLVKSGVDVDVDFDKNYDNHQKIAYKSGDTYIENALESGLITRWNTKKMPITLYIERPTGLAGYQDSYYASVLRAMENWVKSVGDSKVISYKLVDTPQEANIRVFFTNEIMKSTSDNYIAGLATPHIKGKILDYYEVKFIPHPEIYTTALHELGHALGIRGHSNSKTDIMYPETTKNTELSQRDTNTLLLLYTLEPDISNFDDNEIPEKTGKNDKFLDSRDKLLDKKLQEAVEYTQKYPNNVLSWVQLGKIYSDLGKYDMAVTSLKKAMEIDPSYNGAIENLAFTYKAMGKTGEAGDLFKQLNAKEPENTAYANNYAYYLTENNQYKEAKQIIQTLIVKNPSAKDDENIKQLLEYLNKVDY